MVINLSIKEVDCLIAGIESMLQDGEEYAALIGHSEKFMVALLEKLESERKAIK